MGVVVDYLSFWKEIRQEFETEDRFLLLVCIMNIYYWLLIDFYPTCP